MTEHKPLPDRDSERGVAIAMALLFMFIAGTVVISGSLMMRSNEKLSEVRFRRENQASQFARSGLTEAMSWFRRQTSQPVTNFQPLLDGAATPPILDTEDPLIGLVRQFRIGQNIWGRYEVWREDETDPIPTRLDFRRKFQVKDLSLERGYGSAGNVWLIRSIGYVFERRSESVAWNESPNRVLAIATYEGEIQRLSIQPPGQSAICVHRGDACTIDTKGRVRGGLYGAGILYPTSTGSPSIGPLAENRVTGAPATSATGSYDDSTQAVFGVSRNELRTMADLVITDPADIPDPIPTNSIVFVEGPGTVEFDSTRSLNGTGIVFFEGGLSALSGNNSSFNGLLYVEGDVVLHETIDVFGALIAKGSLDVKGVGDYSTIWYDDEVMSSLRRQIGQYRWSGAFRSVINRE